MAGMTTDWRDKDDDDLTSTDLGEMLETGRPVAISGPAEHLGQVRVSDRPTAAVFVTAVVTGGAKTVYAENRGSFGSSVRILSSARV